MRRFAPITAALLSVFLAAPALGQSPIVLKIGHHHNVGGILDQTAHKFKELAAAKSNNRLRVEVFPGAQLGQEREAAEGIRMGTLQVALVSATIFVGAVPGFGVDTLPFLLSSDRNKNHRIFNESAAGKELDKRMVQKGARILGWLNSGFRHMLFIKKEVKGLDEMKGLKMRSPEVDLFVNMYRALSARPTPITWGEVYTALQAGIVDGLDAPFLSIKDARLYEVSKYWLLTGHMWGAYNLLINEKAFQALPKDLQTVVLDAGRETVNAIDKQSMEEDRGLAAFLKEKGMVFNELTPAEVTKFKQAMGPVIDDWAKKHNAADIVSMIRKEVDAK
jgi:tripartite ATP-independent transporter DctP family solute receptor